MAFLAEVRARLGLDTTEFNRALTKAQVDVGAAGADMGRKLQRSFGAGDVFKGLLAGVGLASVQSVVEQIGRLWTGVTKDVEDGYERALKAQERLAEANIKRMRQMASLENQQQLLILERARLEKQIQQPAKPEPMGMGERFLRGVQSAMGGTPLLGQIGALAGSSAEELAKARAEAGGLNKAEQDAQAGMRLLEITEEETRLINEQGRVRERQAAASIELARLREENKMREMTDEQKLAYLQEKRADAEATIRISGDADLSLAREIERVTARILDLEEQIGNARIRAIEQRYAEEQAAMDEERRIQEKYIQQAKEVLRISREYADQEDRVSEAKDKQSQAQKNLQQQKSDRSGLTIEEVASGKYGAVNRAEAKKVMQLEQQARRQRATGFYSAAEESTNRAIELRSRIPSLTASERYPMAQAEEATKSAAEYTSDMVSKLTQIEEYLRPAEIR